MGRDGDLKLAEKIAEAGGKMIREYIAEMRRQGRIKGKLYLVIKEGRKQVRAPYREEQQPSVATNRVCLPLVPKIFSLFFTV